MMCLVYSFDAVRRPQSSVVEFQPLPCLTRTLSVQTIQESSKACPHHAFRSFDIKRNPAVSHVLTYQRYKSILKTQTITRRSSSSSDRLAPKSTMNSSRVNDEDLSTATNAEKQ